MRWDMIGALALVLAAVFLFGRLWFALVETVLCKIKNLFSSRRKPPVWHTYAEEEEDSQSEK